MKILVNALQKAMKAIKRYETPIKGINGEYYSTITPKAERYITKTFSKHHADTPLTIYKNPEYIDLEDGVKGQVVGEYSLSDKHKLFADVMKKRWNNYKYVDFDYNKKPVSEEREFLSYDLDNPPETLDDLFNTITDKKQLLYVPLGDSNWGGFYTRGNKTSHIRWYPDPPYYAESTPIHEGIAHATDPVVHFMYTKDGIPVDHMYNILSEPVAIFGHEPTYASITDDSLRYWEARASNWEMISKLYDELAAKKGITPLEAYKLPDKEFLDYVDEISDEHIIDLLRRTNGYTSQYVNLIRSSNNAEAVNEYLDTWRHALKFLPSAFLAGYGLSRYNRNGGKLIPRKMYI